MEKALSQREFDTWRATDTAFKAQMLAHMTVQSEINLDVEGRLSAVQASQDDCENTVKRRTTWIASLVSAVVGGIVGAFSGGMK